MSDEDSDEATRLVGQRIQALRKERGLTMEELALEADLSKGHLSKLERGLQSPSIKTLNKLASVLDVEILDLCTFPGQSDRHELVEAARTGRLAEVLAAQGKTSEDGES